MKEEVTERRQFWRGQTRKRGQHLNRDLGWGPNKPGSSGPRCWREMSDLQASLQSSVAEDLRGTGRAPRCALFPYVPTASWTRSEQKQQVNSRGIGHACCPSRQHSRGVETSDVVSSGAHTSTRPYTPRLLEHAPRPSDLLRGHTPDLTPQAQPP